MHVQWRRLRHMGKRLALLEGLKRLLSQAAQSWSEARQGLLQTVSLVREPLARALGGCKE